MTKPTPAMNPKRGTFTLQALMLTGVLAIGALVPAGLSGSRHDTGQLRAKLLP